MESFTEIVANLELVEQQLSDAIFEAVRKQLREGSAEEAKELERNLAKVRRSVQKAQHLLRNYES
jgi:hypothetical protein